MAKKKKLKKGFFITFEGVEGCGKSTHSLKLYNMLRKQGLDCIYIREPGSTKIGEKIRKILLSSKNNEMADKTELFLFEANRSQIVKEVIKPALKKKKIIICDRFFDSTTAYQGYAEGLSVNFIEKVNRFASDGIAPDLTIVLDIQPEIGLKRAVRGRKKDRMESKLLSYHKLVRSGYRKLAQKYKKRIKLIKVMPDIKETYDLVREAAFSFYKNVI